MNREYKELGLKQEKTTLKSMSMTFSSDAIAVVRFGTVLITARKIIKIMRSPMKFPRLRCRISLTSRGFQRPVSIVDLSLEYLQAIDHFMVGAIVRKERVVKTIN
jgi:hypothetical protein